MTDLFMSDLFITNTKDRPCIMHLSMLIPGGKGAGNGWGFDCEFYPHRQAFENDFFPGCGRFVMQFQYEAWSLESRKPEVQKLLLFISASASIFSSLLEF